MGKVGTLGYVRFPFQGKASALGELEFRISAVSIWIASSHRTARSLTNILHEALVGLQTRFRAIVNQRFQYRNRRFA